MPPCADNVHPAPGLSVRIVLALVTAYQWLISPLLVATCRFVPSCSAYAAEALLRHGLIAGGWLTLRRLARCHPLCRGGLDQVPLPRRPAR